MNAAMHQTIVKRCLASARSPSGEEILPVGCSKEGKKEERKKKKGLWKVTKRPFANDGKNLCREEEEEAADDVVSHDSSSSPSSSS